MGLFLLSGPVSQHLINPGHNVIGAREGNRISQRLVTLQRPDLHAVRPVLCPALPCADYIMAGIYEVLADRAGKEE